MEKIMIFLLQIGFYLYMINNNFVGQLFNDKQKVATK